MDELTTPYNAEDFDTLRQVRGDGTEYWTGRDLNRVTGYAGLQKFEVAVKRAIAAIANMQMDVTSHVNQISRLVERPQGGSIQQGDFELSRYAAHLVMINGDPRKPEIAKAQTYFAVKTREAELAPAVPVALPGRRELAQMVLEAEDRADREAIARTRVEHKLEKQHPVADYHQRFVAESQDIVTIDNFASQYGPTGPKVRELMKDKGVTVHQVVAQRWSKSNCQLVDDYGWRPRQGVLSSTWFVLRQHRRVRVRVRCRAAPLPARRRPPPPSRTRTSSTHSAPSPSDARRR